MSVKDRISLFYSYAHKDEVLRNDLHKHLSVLFKSGLIDQWYDREIRAGMEWAKLIDDHLNTAQIILLLISADFMASDFCYGVEMKRAIERHNAGEARVIPIILRPVHWDLSPFSKLKVLPKDGLAVTTWQNRDEAFDDITKQILIIVNELQRKTSISQQDINVNGEPKTSVAKEDENIQQGPVLHHAFQPVEKFRSCQKKVKELKTIHNKLHDTEMQLRLPAMALKLITRTKVKTKKGLLDRVFVRDEIKISLSDLDFIEIEQAWRSVARKIDALKHFVFEEIEVSDKHSYIDTNRAEDHERMTELFNLQQSFENCIRDSDVEEIKLAFDALLDFFREYLSSTNTRLSDAIDELRHASEILLKDRS